MACNNLGVFAVDTSSSLDLCFSAQTDTVYGESLILGEELYIDPGCAFTYSLVYLSNGINLYSTNGAGKIIGITGCSCNFLGTFSAAPDPELSCIMPPSFDLYGTALLTGCTVYTDSGCTSPALLGFYSDGVTIYSVDGSGMIDLISACSCPGLFCVQNDTTYDDTYQYAGIYDGESYYTGQSTNYVIYYSTGESRWCLAQNLGDPCDQFGPYGSTSDCPDLDDSVVYFGPCTTTTTTINPCSTLDLDALFDCLVTPTPTVTPSNTPTPTPTPTPTTSNICGGVSMVISVSGITPTPTPSFTPSPTPTPVIERPCNFSGEVIFNQFSEIIQCANSKKFRDCFTGIQYFTSDLVLVSGSTQPKEGYVYNAIINGQNYCVIYDGLFENISGVDNISLTNEVGSSNEGACLDCSTPSPNPISECLVINSECGIVNVSPGPFINGKLSYEWSFPYFPQYVYQIYWDSINLRWVCKETISNQVGAYLNIASEVPVGSVLDWDYQDTPFDSTNCIEELAGFFTTILEIPCPSLTPTPTPTPSPSPCILYEYRVTNLSPAKISIQYTSCKGSSTSQSMNPNSSVIVCSSTVPTSNNPQNTQITPLGFVC